jgi:DHA2 family multidrug resistance protein
MSANLTSSGAWFQDSIRRTTDYLASQGYSHADAARAAYLRCYNQMIAQTSLLGFMDVFRAIGWVTLAVTPLLFFVRRFSVSGKPSGGH